MFEKGTEKGQGRGWWQVVQWPPRDSKFVLGLDGRNSLIKG